MSTLSVYIYPDWHWHPSDRYKSHPQIIITIFISGKANLHSPLFEVPRVLEVFYALLIKYVKVAKFDILQTL
jgi:hypothetical protein